MAEQENKKPDLNQLDLATGIDRIPEWWNRHGNKVLIAVTILAVAYALFTFRRNTTEQARINAETNLATARELLSSLRSSMLAAIPAEQYSDIRRDVLREGTTRMGEVLSQSTDPILVSQALVLQGNLYYAVAILPEMEEATTRPTLRLEQTSDQLLESARTAYQAVLDQFADRTQSVGAARLGLAAIAENKGEFDVAKTLYQGLADDEKMLTSYRTIAKDRLTLLPNLSTPMRIRLGTPTTAPAAPTWPTLPALPTDPTIPPASPTTTPATLPARP